MVTIILTEEDILNLEEQTVFARTEARVNHRKVAYGASEEENKILEISKQGYAGEAAVCKFQGIHYKHQLFGIDTGKFEVRTTKYKTGRLILHPKDRDNCIFILVIGNIFENNSFDLVGWIMGKEGKQAQYWIDPTGRNRYAFFVPQEKLNPMEELPLDR